MRQLCFLLFSTVILQHSAFSQMTSQEIITMVEENLNGKSAIMTITMHITTNRSQRTLEMESYSIGNSKSFIRVNYPRKDRGITFLKIDNTMWQYVPRI